MIATTRREIPADERYIELVRHFPLRVIRNDAELEDATTIVDELLDLPAESDAERDYLAVLGLLIEDYEREHVKLPEVSGVDLLRHLMEENGLSQKDIAPLFGGNRSVVSEIMHGKRGLALNHIRRLSEYFGLPAHAFMS